MRIFGLTIVKSRKLYDESLDLIELGISLERDRVIEIVAQETRHGGKTHYEGNNCQTCRILQAISGEQQ